MIHRDEIGRVVESYLDRHPSEHGSVAPLVTALGQLGDLASRKTFTGHVTCSAVIVDPSGRVLHIRHNILNRWLRPGGHLEDDDTSLIGAALREVAEETGIPADQLTLVDDLPIDIDVHPIPANPAKGEPDHQHFDLRFAFAAPSDVAVTLQVEEVNGFRWLDAAQVEPDAVRAKLRVVFA